MMIILTTKQQYHIKH